jgi:hypothetical protein
MSDDNKPVEFSGTLSDLGDMSGVQTTYPVLAAALLPMRIKGFKKEDKTKDDGTIQSTLLVELATEDFAKQNLKPDADIAPGHILTHRILLTPVGGWTKESTQKALAVLMDAALGSHEGEFNTEKLLNQVISVSVAVRPERNDEKTGRTYPVSNEIKKFIPKTV